MLLCASWHTPNLSLTQFHLHNKLFKHDKDNYTIKDAKFGVPRCVTYNSITKSVLVGTRRGYIVNMGQGGDSDVICRVGDDKYICDKEICGIHVSNDVIFCVTGDALYSVSENRKVTKIYDMQAEDKKTMSDVTTLGNNNKNLVSILYSDKIRVVNFVTKSCDKCLGKFTGAEHIRRDEANDCYVVCDHSDKQIVIISDDGVVY